jgi:prepilin signal peptidase PulO-like enzyme (type II secretory pathway)
VKLAGKGSYIRFGPFLAVGTWIVMMDGPRVLDLWLAFAGSTTALFR